MMKLGRMITAIAGAGLLFSAAEGCGDENDEGGAAATSPTAGGGCADDAAYFATKVWEPILSLRCVGCHNSEGPAKGTRMVLKRADEPGAVEANFEIVKAMAGVKAGSTSILLLKPTNRHQEGHTGGEMVKYGSPDYASLETFVERVTVGGAACTDSGAIACTDVKPGKRSLRRLSRIEYDNTIHDLFGFESTWGASFTPENMVNGFDNNAEVLTVSPLLADQLRKAADEIATTAVTDTASLLPCDPVQMGESACVDKFIKEFGERAFRRPIDDADVARYRKLYNLAAPDGLAEGLKLVITGMLQSPHFLYRAELGSPSADGLYELTPHEIAAELSYFLWGSMPDKELLDAARSGALKTPAEIEAQARRMLESPKSRPMIDRFVSLWLGLDRLPVVPKDSAVYPEITADMRAEMAKETRRFVDYVLREGSGKLPELLTADYSFMSDELAAFYGIKPGEPDTASGLKKTALPADTYAGLLTQGSVLLTHASPGGSSPIHRGKLVRERLFCQELPPPPPSLNVQPPPVDPTLTTRERFKAHSDVDACTGCHRLIDPIGFGFEHFDGLGRYRDAESGKTVDATGEILGTASSNTTFDGVSDLAGVLAESPEVQSCFALQWLRFAYGLEETDDLACLAKKVGDDFGASGLTVNELIVSLTKTPHFTVRQIDEDVEEPAGGSTSGGGTSTSTSSSSSSSASSSSSSSSGGSTGGDPPVNNALKVTETTDSTWATGHCNKVVVMNTSSMSIDWEVTLDIDGTLTQNWSSNATVSGKKATFSGLDWNNVVDAGASVDFGYCVEF